MATPPNQRWQFAGFVLGAIAWAGAAAAAARDRDPLSMVDRDPWDRGLDRDGLYGGTYRDRDFYGALGGSYRDYYGGSYRDYYAGGRDFPDRREPAAEDDCSRVEAKGVLLANTLREAAELLINSSRKKPAPQLTLLLEFFAGVKHRRFLLAHCPQAVVLAVLLQTEIEEVTQSGAQTAEQLTEMLSGAPALRSPYRAPPQWTGTPWEPLLHAAQQRTGIVLFPTGEQQFLVEHVAAKDWSIHPQRRCAGRRDLGNLQATPLATCLAKCTVHPLCTSATFWHWQPGFKQRCFLSSTCTVARATGEGAEGAVLFEKVGGQTPREKVLMQRTVVTPDGAPWAPRCGHRMLSSSIGGHVQLWVFGGVGVDPFANTSVETHNEADESLDPYWAVGSGKSSSSGSSTGSRQRGTKTPSTGRGTKAGADAWHHQGGGSKRQGPNSTASSVVEAYLSRHVELSGELPPLRSLPYGRLSDVWRSDDLGSSWNLVTSEAAWGHRAFFGAAAFRGGRAFVLLGGVREPAPPADTNGPSASASLSREYMNDVWWADLSSGAMIWHSLDPAPWTRRAAFQAVVRSAPRNPDGLGQEQVEELLVLGGRMEDGTLRSDVWEATLHAGSKPVVEWKQLTATAPWAPRADFAAAAFAVSNVCILGGCDHGGRALTDVWCSSDGTDWQEAVRVAPWGPRVGAAAESLGKDGPLLLFGGYAYPDSGFGPVSATALEGAWAAASWVSQDGVHWQPLNVTRMSWAPSAMHAALVAAPCGSNRKGACAYAAGGLTHEGYYDNSVHRLLVPVALGSALQANLTPSAVAPPAEAQPSSHRSSLDAYFWSSGAALVVTALMAIALLHRKRNVTTKATSVRVARGRPPLDPCVQLILGLLVCLCVLGGLATVYLLRALTQLSHKVEEMQNAEPLPCSVDAAVADRLSQMLGLQRLTEQSEQFETLLRLASREPQFGYGSLGGYHDYWRGSGKSGDPYSYGGRNDRSYGLDLGYGTMDDPLPPEGGSGPSALARELALLPTTQGLSCRSPRCDRNVSACGSTSISSTSLTSPFGCCSDYMNIMLVDVTEWLAQQRIPYFVTYGTLLGALREGEIMPHTQDMDIVVDRAHWPQLQRGLEAAEFFGGRRYLFGVDQWEEKVSRICADWEGFAPSAIGGPDGDRLSRATEFHLDVYASDWWQITDLHLIDCIEPLGTSVVPIHGRNFSAPARPRACVEKLYGADWRTPKHALSGVN